MNKTAEEILRGQFYGEEWEELMSSLNTDVTPSIVKAMKAYAQQECEKVRQECADNANINHYLYCQSQIEDEVERCGKQCVDCLDLQIINLDRVSEFLNNTKVKND